MRKSNRKRAINSLATNLDKYKKSGITTSEIITDFILRVIQRRKVILLIVKALLKKRSVKEKQL